MGTTPRVPLNYPEAGDLVTAGHANVRQLAEDVEAAIATSYALTGPADGQDTAGSSLEQFVELGELTSSTDWSLVDDTLVYNGPGPRWFNVTAGLRYQASDGTMHRVETKLVHNAAVVDEAFDVLQVLDSAPALALVRTVRLSAPVHMVPGDVLSVRLRDGDSSGTVTAHRFRAISTGPVETNI